MNWFCKTNEAIEHKKTCTKKSWECGKCIWIDESSNAMAELGTFVPRKINNQTNKQTQVETQGNFDKLAQQVTHKPVDPDAHPLLPEILRVFKGRKV